MCVSCCARVKGSLQMVRMSLWMDCGLVFSTVSLSVTEELILARASSYWLSVVSLRISACVICCTALRYSWRDTQDQDLQSFFYWPELPVNHTYVKIDNTICPALIRRLRKCTECFCPCKHLMDFQAYNSAFLLIGQPWRALAHRVFRSKIKSKLHKQLKQDYKNSSTSFMSFKGSQESCMPPISSRNTRWLWVELSNNKSLTQFWTSVA